MAIDFPASPSTNDTHSHNGLTWKYDGTTWVLQATTNNNTFSGLSDTPSSYTANKFVKVNSGATALEFTDAPQNFTSSTNKTNAYNLQPSDIGNVIKMTSPSSGTNLQLGIPDLSSSLSYGDEVRIQNGTADYITVTTAATTVYWGGGVNVSSTTGVGQEEFTTAGVYSWTCPVGVTKVSVVTIGGGGGGANVGMSGGGSTWYGAAGAGGGLAFVNNVTVTTGTVYTVRVGYGGTGSNAPYNQAWQNWPGYDGGNSFFSDSVTTFCESGGGAGGGAASNGSNITHSQGGQVITGTGGAGGNGTVGQNINGGGGAGGYNGDGGQANVNSGDAASGSGAGGAGGGGGSMGGAGGGGVGIYGLGATGTGGRAPGTWGGNTNNGSEGGIAGSGGVNGDSIASYGASPGADGGAYGGGGGVGYHNHGGNGNIVGAGGEGSGGAVRIMWGSGRSYPSTLTADQTAVAGGTSSTGNRKIAGYALVTLTYIGNNTWNIHGDGVF